MFERILLPLDGSQLAEVAVPYAEYLAGRLGSEVILLHVCHSEEGPYRNMHQIYLGHMANIMQREMRKGLPKSEQSKVRAEVLVGEPADMVCDYVEKNDIKMIVMAARGGSGLKVWFLGSVADKVVRAVKIPVLLVRAQNGRPVSGGGKLISRILLPLDGSDASKRSVPYALELAKRLKASISLFGMAERAQYTYTFSEGMVEEYARMEAAAERSIRAHLIEVEKELRQEGVRVTHAVTRGIDAASEILGQEKKTNTDLVVMATRGRSPIGRWVFGSVAEKVLREGDLPLLLVREVAE
ncbi:universal stress protein [Chloroflexota bacterium]